MAIDADIVVVGAGSAGCVLAARLSEDERCTVALVEAGPDYGAAVLPEDVRSAADFTASHDWGYVSEETTGGKRIGLLRGRLVGGTSAVNACFALRGDPSVYDEWAALGNTGWSFENVLPTFAALEHDHDFDGPWHGHDGPLGIRRYRRDELTPVHAAFLNACRALGYPDGGDLNHPGAQGAALAPTNAIDGVRQSAALTHLEPARDRPNLRIVSDAEVDRVLVSGARATGVQLSDGRQIRANEVILSAGAYGSPAILLRSGIGPADELGELGVTVHADVPGVGQNLVDHPVVWQFGGVDDAAPSGSPAFQAVLSWTSRTAGTPDLHVFSRYAHADGPLLGVFASVMRPTSRGSVRLAGPDPATPPRIDPAFLTTSSDVERMGEAVEIARDVLHAEPLSNLIVQDLSASGDLAAHARSNVQTYFHAVGSCRMGPAGDPLAVVDPIGRMHAIEGLSVVDASIMPTIPSANTNLPTMMIGEHVIRLRRHGPPPAQASPDSESDRIPASG